ncbi:asparagine synthase (glutamine-hydrolyzing), partial [Candidatus Aminicenantes bacterium AC-335-A11]|nr:asparagine synthase (glutamine-hydrolyzing) [Candidatus Aminicenantes bacterium AC-335-A11]
MCGICGIVHTEKPVPLSLIKSMCDSIIHRGPDDEGIFINENVALGARRLSIIDLVTGHQPLSNEDGNIWIAYNGEVYNFPELRNELVKRGHKFKSKGDTETVVHSYEEWGENFVKKLRGMFAFAIWDGREKKLILVRDRIGIKPLYYTLLKDGTIVFGSELKTLLKYQEIEKEIDFEALDLFLTLEYIPAPYTIFKNVKKLKAGHILIYKNGKIKIKKYWDIEEKCDSLKIKDINEYCEQLYYLLKESVKLRLISDVPLGCFLSGGIDSSTIVGLMSELGVKPVKTFSIGFEEKSYNELKFARIIAKKFNTEHHEFTITPEVMDLTEKLINYLDEPFGDFSIFPTYLVSKIARDYVKVILSGDGGDEVFGGYEHYQAQKLASIPFLFPLNHFLKYALSPLPPQEKKKKGFWNKLKRYSEGFYYADTNRHFRWMMFLNYNYKKKLYSPALFNDLKNSKNILERYPFIEYLKNAYYMDDINKELYLDLKTYLSDDILVKVDRMSMAVSLETRVPLLDHKLVEFVFQIPGKYKLKGLKTKWIFKKTMERLLPKENI